MSQEGITARIEVGASSFAKPGQGECGDLWSAKRFASGWLIAAVDGSGHGTEAAAAARTALDELEKHPDEDVISLVSRCHEKLKRTRGAVMSLASINVQEGSLTWIGVGNVEGVLLHWRAESGNGCETLLLRPGVLGYNLPPLQKTMASLQRGDTLVFATDGIRAGFVEALFPNDPPQQLADAICSRYAKGTDDGLVLVVRYLG